MQCFEIVPSGHARVWLVCVFCPWLQPAVMKKLNVLNSMVGIGGISHYRKNFLPYTHHCLVAQLPLGYLHPSEFLNFSFHLQNLSTF